MPGNLLVVYNVINEKIELIVMALILNNYLYTILTKFFIIYCKEILTKPQKRKYTRRSKNSEINDNPSKRTQSKNPGVRRTFK